MPLSKRLARFNRVGTNRVLGVVAPRLPGFGVVIHTGRRSGRVYRTPVNVFLRDEWVVIALTYGADADWVKNVLAANGCELVTRGRHLQLGAPRLVHDEERSAIPGPARVILGWTDVSDFLTLHVEKPQA